MNEIQALAIIVIKGLLIGIIASAPMGPVGVLCLQRSLNKGRLYGFLTGVGAAISDLFYALITGFGMSFVFEYVNQNIYYLQLFGSILLLAFGYYTFQSNPVHSIRPVNKNNKSYLNNIITAFLVTLSNPLIILLFIALFARFSFVDEGWLVSETVTGYASMVVGALLWWLLLSFAVNKLRKQFNLRGLWMLNRVVGALVMLVALGGLVYTLLGESMY